ncbi:hypothetical protein LK09_09410 [Microbacterium mangrovi]|uniref:Uncharacterized protein n=1 Tax=Microbacterium mangrovi TaxID=1348253 RepID=A0A0B2A4P3_9MICO|nr:GAP family protein [Microbacterium mangrovi]KHK98030.1 hypothetical protein LK09_09410 [Microbacterium mangrovi]
MSVLWYTLPIAVALALSIFPIIAALLLLLSPEPLSRSIPFAIGSVLGIAVLVTAFALGASLIPTASESRTPSWVHVVEIVVGAALGIVAAFLLARKTASPGMDMSKVAAATGRLTPARALGFGLVMNVRPKSLALTVAAGLAIGTAHVDALSDGVTVLVFTVVAGSTVAGLVIAYAIGQERIRPQLERLRAGLATHAGLVLNAALLCIGVILIGAGVTQLASA